MCMHVYAWRRDDARALRWLKPDMAIVVGDLGEEDEQLAQAMVQGLTEAQVTPLEHCLKFDRPAVRGGDVN